VLGETFGGHDGSRLEECLEAVDLQAIHQKAVNLDIIIMESVNLEVVDWEACVMETQTIYIG
jgi:hypothetical protein